ncbi:MAG TPA: hypothetical protein VFS31_14290, partial [Chitinophagaceae bacterium]|nr:hypothetical protein [Chitinophagaceae bacterium]
MSEYLPNPELAVDDYQDFVDSTDTSGAALDEVWDKGRSELLFDEYIEAMFQHGRGFGYILPGYSYDMKDDKLRFKVADELGDILWFSTNILSKKGLRLSESLSRYLSERTGHRAHISTFADLQRYVLVFASDITVANKLTYLGLGHSELARTNVKDNPFYFLTRSINRLGESLAQP